MRGSFSSSCLLLALLFSRNVFAQQRYNVTSAVATSSSSSSTQGASNSASNAPSTPIPSTQSVSSVAQSQGSASTSTNAVSSQTNAASSTSLQDVSTSLAPQSSQVSTAPGDTNTATFTGVASTATTALFSYAPASSASDTNGGFIASAPNTASSTQETGITATQSATGSTGPTFVLSNSNSPAFTFQPASADQTLSTSALFSFQPASAAQTSAKNDLPVTPAAFPTPTGVLSGSAASGSLALVSPTGAATFSTVTAASSIITIGGAAVSRASNGAYMVSNTTLTPGMSVTLGSGAHSTIVALQTAYSGFELILRDASTTASTFLPASTQSSLSTPTFLTQTQVQSSIVVVNGQTYTVGATVLSPAATVIASATAYNSPGLQSGTMKLECGGMIIGTLAVLLGLVHFF